MKRRERQGRRQRKEAQILVGRKAPPDPHPLPCFKPRSPRPGLLLLREKKAAVGLAIGGEASGDVVAEQR